MLPIANYEFDASLSFTQAASNPKLPVKLDRNGLEVGSYLLPIIPTDCAGMPFDISKAICYIHVMITEQLPQIDLKNKATLKASSTVQWSGEEIKMYWITIRKLTGNLSGVIGRQVQLPAHSMTQLMAYTLILL